MKLTTLIENHTSRRDLKAEHGLSFLIEDGGEKILFDTGNSGAVWDNAGKLGISPKDITATILSHSHYDHVGGLMEGVKRGLSGRLIVGEKFFEEKYRIQDEDAYTYTYLGCGFSAAWAKENFHETAVCRELLQVSSRCWAVGRFKRTNLWEEISKRFVKEKDGVMTVDSFEDEICLVILLPDKEAVGVICGCSHPGIINMLETVRERFPGKELEFVAGGIHLKERNEAYREKTLRNLKNMGIRSLFLNHCSGENLYWGTEKTVFSPGSGDCLFLNHLSGKMSEKPRCR